MRSFQLIAVLIVIVGSQQAAFSQPSAERFFGFLDRNRDGRIDQDEAQRLPGPFREAMQRARVDFSRGVSQSEFARIMPGVMEQARAQRESDGGRGDGRGPEDYRRRGDDRGGDRSRSRSSSGSSKPTRRWQPRKVERITLDLQDSWKEADLNGDGQVALYEWDRAKFREFFALDVNHDGFLTPRELAQSGDAKPAAASSTQLAANKASSPAVSSRGSGSTKGSSPPSSLSGGAITPVQFDEKSTEGRWAKYVFGRLDKDKDGSLTKEEWEQSKSTRGSFEKHKANLSFPAKFADFAGLLVAVQRAEKKR